MFLIAPALLLMSFTANSPPRKVGACKWVHGRFDVWNGSGVRRIWVIGTHRLIALWDADDNVPQAVRDYVYSGPYLSKADGLYGDFRVCALEPSLVGHMQHVRLIAVRDLKFRGEPFKPKR